MEVTSQRGRISLVLFAVAFVGCGPADSGRRLDDSSPRRFRPSAVA